MASGNITITDIYGVEHDINPDHVARISPDSSLGDRCYLGFAYSTHTPLVVDDTPAATVTAINAAAATTFDLVALPLVGGAGFGSGNLYVSPGSFLHAVPASPTGTSYVRTTEGPSYTWHVDLTPAEIQTALYGQA